jgi:uracil-DNA glycosylase
MYAARSKRRQVRLRSLRRVYAEIAKWTQDRAAVPRVLEALNPCADLMVVGEAVGPETLRRSGINYFRVDGTLGRTGKYLDEMLRPLGFTVYPSSDIQLMNGTHIESGTGARRETAYCTDLCPEFPGQVSRRKGKAIKKSVKRPASHRVREALTRGFLEREIDLVQPKVILLLGSSAYITFYTHFLKQSDLSALGKVVEDLPRHLAHYKASLVVPFLHPSPASLSFLRWFKEFAKAPTKSTFVRCIQDQLRR